jgi:hypothetical protein
VAQGSHPEASLAPAVQIECAHDPLPELPALVLVELLVEPPVDVLLVDMLPPQGLVTGTQARARAPSAVLIGVQAWPEGHVVPSVQSVAQYVSPANWPQTRPAPQPGVVTQPWQSPPPPAPVALVEAVAPPAPSELVPEPDSRVLPPAEHEAPATTHATDNQDTTQARR